MKLCDHMHRINYLFGEISAAYHQMAVQFHMPDSCMQVLYTLCDNGETCPLSEVYKQTGLTKQTVNSAVRKLEREGVLILQQHTGRAKDLILTDSGKALAKKTVSHLFQMENDIFSSWSPEEVAAYVFLTERYANDCRKKVEAFHAGRTTEKKGSEDKTKENL